MTGTVTEADLIAGIVKSCDGVAAMSTAGRTYLPGRTVPGVRIDQDNIDVHVIVFYGTPIMQLGAAISARLTSQLVAAQAGRTVTVHVEDIVMPGEDIALPGQAIVVPHQPLAVPAHPVVVADGPASPVVLPPLDTTPIIKPAPLAAPMAPTPRVGALPDLLPGP